MTKSIVIVAMYKFVRLDNHEAMQPIVLSFCQQREIYGTLLLAEEGLNGTLAGTRSAIDALLVFLKSDRRLADLEYKESYSDEVPFHRTKVKMKKEIVTMGQPNIKPSDRSGIRVEPEQWNEIISDPEVLLIDTRNEYEYQIGTFKDAVSPDTTNFREFPEYVTKQAKSGDN